MPSLVKICPVVLEKKIFKCCQCNFAILFNPQWLRMIFNSIHIKMLFAKFGLNWPSGSEKDDENVKS